jgi:hypothetical protein
VALQAPLNNKFVTKNIRFAGITSVADPCAAHVRFHALKNAYNYFKTQK